MSSDMQLSTLFKNLITESKIHFSDSNAEIDYIHYDFHAECKKNTNPLEDYIDK